MLEFPKELFQLQVEFARRLADIYEESFAESLYKYTSIYTRLIGFSDAAPPSMENEIWKDIIKQLPSNQKDQEDFIYGKYVEFEGNKKKEKPVDNGQIKFGSFSYFYKEKENTFALHFINFDPKGNLSRDRIEQRKIELKSMSDSIKSQGKSGATTYMTSWLLSIEALRRLLPPKFLESAKPRNKGAAQDNGSWGQFVDKDGNFKPDMAKKLLNNTTERKELVDEYFPLRMIRAETEQEVFFEFFT